MKCISCAADVPDDGAFCPKCGARQGLPGVPPPAPALEPEVPVWEGRYSFLADGLSWILWAIFVGSALFVAFKWLSLSENWARLVYGGAVLLPGIALLVTALVRRLSVRYRLTTHRLFKEVGIISRRISEIELLRVDDLSVSQNLVQRIFDVGVVSLQTNDASDPRMDITGIRHPVDVKEQIRTNVQKRRSRSINLETI